MDSYANIKYSNDICKQNGFRLLLLGINHLSSISKWSFLFQEKFKYFRVIFIEKFHTMALFRPLKKSNKNKYIQLKMFFLLNFASQQRKYANIKLIKCKSCFPYWIFDLVNSYFGLIFGFFFVFRMGRLWQQSYLWEHSKQRNKSAFWIKYSKLSALHSTVTVHKVMSVNE